MPEGVTEPVITEPVTTEPQSWDDVFGALPEDVRPTLEPFGQRLAEYDEHKSKWDRYAEIGVDELEPDALKGWFDWLGQLDSPDTAKDALLQLAETVGVDLASPAVEPVTPATPAAGEPPAELTAALQKIDELESRLNGRDEAEQRAQIEQEVQTALKAEWEAVSAEYETSLGRKPTDEETGRLRNLAKLYAKDSETPIKDAYEFITSLTAAAGNELVAGAPRQPDPAARPGRPATVASPPQTFEEAEAAMRQRLGTAG